MSDRIDDDSLEAMRADPRGLCSPEELTILVSELQIRRAADLSEENLTALRRWASAVLKNGAMTRLDADALTGVLLVIAAHQETRRP